MSRVGLKPIHVPDGVDVQIDDSNEVTVKGPKGSLSRKLDESMKIHQDGNVITIDRPSEKKNHKMLHGTTRSLLSNMVEGVSDGFIRTLTLSGVGYRAQLSGKKLVLNVGYSHPVEIEPEEGVEVEVPEQTRVIVKGIDKERVGAVAANIRSVRLPEPYKGKGITYVEERIRRKEGKTGN